MELVTVLLFCFWTPRMTMQKWLASSTTATPCAFSTSSNPLAICVGKPFLYLQAPCKDIHHTGNLAQTNDCVPFGK